MPLDGHAHLVAQGWSGKGTGLRHGAITKPVTVVQKKTLAGIGKDRDEAFPFWDHVFQAAAVSITVKVHNSDDESDTSGESASTPAPSLKRTSTGIISNRRPLSGTPALSGTNTPSEAQASGSGCVTPRLSIMAIAKQQAARRMLYSIFYRGPVLTNEDEKSGNDEPAGAAEPSSAASPSLAPAKAATDVKKSKKRKAEREGSEEKQERKKRKREAKEKEGKSRSKSMGKRKAADKTDESDDADVDMEREDRKPAKAVRRAEKAERKGRKEERRARKEERRKEKLHHKAAKTQDDERDSDAVIGGSSSQLTTAIVAEPSETAKPSGVSSDTLQQKRRKRKSKPLK